MERLGLLPFRPGAVPPRAHRAAALAGAFLLSAVWALLPVMTQARAQPAAPPVLRPVGSLRLAGAADGVFAGGGRLLWLVAAGPAGLEAASRSPASGWRWAPRLVWPPAMKASGLRVEATTALVDRSGRLHVLLTTAPATPAGDALDLAARTTWYAELAGGRWLGPERVGEGPFLSLGLRPGTGGKAEPVVTLASGFDAQGALVERSLLRTGAGWQPAAALPVARPPLALGWSHLWDAAPVPGTRDWVELVSREGQRFLEVVKVAPDGRPLADLGRIPPPVATDAPVFHLLGGGPRWYVVYRNTVGRLVPGDPATFRWSEELRIYAEPSRPAAGRPWPEVAAFGTDRTPLAGLRLVAGGTRAVTAAADGRLFLLWRLAPATGTAAEELWLTELAPAGPGR
ncbi:MAG: hypothetical protein QJR14_10545 [Bacillota bacterium]|nr:hypothetical protein [Bacillota bacterium]